ncbi:nuclear transport factor 2 family protein [Olleya marilimosa]|uniref:Nuclear transport factor 2 family protein n=1 Tax=Olleya marilimosa TaxID=272164 RepID=A0ABR8LSE1_9FLAO|nr:nuclear transport factor 2 family protein [Olleya marilimosa]MBD3862029.1 nuclear transport factor 2 family protein [Olleya marilimosa]MBD3889523.1 nuclear transport factor 2 family protein [Olleya marilimosa]
MSARAIVKAFYSLDLAKAENAIEMFDKNCQLHWNSSQGYTALDYNGIDQKLKEVRQSFVSFTYKLSHLLKENDTITARYTAYAATIERPDKVEPIAHFISIWEVKDGLLYKGYEISQLFDENPSSLPSYS